jgi:hypothetical protein
MILTALLELPAPAQRRIVRALQTGRLEPPFEIALLRTVVGDAERDLEVIRAELLDLTARGMDGPSAAAVLEIVREQARNADRPLLVWTGPTVPGLVARDTREVFEELLGEAQRRIWLSTFALHNAPRMFKPLADRMDAVPDMHVSLLLNIGRPFGSKTTAADLVAKFAHDLWTRHWPGDRRPDVFYDPRSIELAQPEGVLHAKALVVDERVAFVGSANLTEAAFDRNFEAGVLSRDRALAGSLARHFRTLVEHGKVVPLP